jgi:hypothetical protein
MITENDEKYWELFKVSVENVAFNNLELGRIYALKIPGNPEKKILDGEHLGIYTGFFTGKEFELFDYWKYSPQYSNADGSPKYFYSDGSPISFFENNYDKDKGAEGKWLEFETSYHPSNVNECLFRLPKDSTEIYLIPETHYAFAHRIFWEWRADSLVTEERLGE